ncbi:MAG: iron ABC transporter substrate-binding protein [Burkholderiales bacterium]|nr:iron ABC transporter substrate-binding protein [Burkholderiales bacterium]
MTLAGRAAGALLAACTACAAAAQATITDATGRAVAVSVKVERVYAAGPPASVFVLALAPRKLVSWTRALRPDEVPFLPDDVARLPELGRLTGRGSSANVEVLMAAKPDVIVDIGSTSLTYVSLATRVQETTGIPYLLFDGRLADSPRLLRELGRAIGAAAEGERLAAYVETSLASIAARIATIPQERRPRVFYARGANGLATAPRGSLQAEVFDLAGARNVAEPPPGFPGNLFNVSLEQVLLWQPDVIVTIDPAFARAVRARPEWQSVPAVKNNRIHVAPELPFGWIDAPPAVNRLLGLEWLVRILHPAAFPEPLGPRIEEFHRRFYHRAPTDAQVSALLATAGLPR